MITESGTVFDVPLEQTAPQVLEYDDRSAVLNKAIADGLKTEFGLVEPAVGIYYRVDDLTELMCDILATDLHIDWYNWDWDLETKRSMVKNSISIHKKMGTVYAVKLMISLLTTGNYEITEWFDYDDYSDDYEDIHGEAYPYYYYFKVTINETELGAGETPDYYTNLDNLVEAIYYSKPVRAHMGELDYGTTTDVIQEFHYGTYLAPWSLTELPCTSVDPALEASGSSALGELVLSADVLGNE